MEIAQREDEWKQRVFAASVGPYDRELYWHLFDPEGLQQITGGDSPARNVLFPTTEEEFEEMIRLWEEEDALAEAAASRTQTS